MKQIHFDLGFASEYNESDFILSLCNLDAFNSIIKNANWVNNRFLLIGEEGCGKTHLANIWKTRTNAVELCEGDVFSRASAFLIENIERIKNEEYLFHLLNHCQNNSLPLLMTAEKYPAFTLRDLNSRIKATLSAIIKSPDEEFIRVLLHKFFAEQQLLVSEEVLDYLIARVERNFTYLKNLTTTIDKLSLEEKRNITIPFVKEVLARV
ncbi:MAG: hypothetical protein ACHP6I_01485 [Rickettsiales bacterium]